MKCLLQFDRVSKRFEEGTLAVDEVSFSVPAGQFCVLLGASGAGKSTLLRMVNGLVTPSGGGTIFDGIEVKAATLRQVQPRIGMIHQQFNLVGRLSVLDNVLTGALPRVSTPRAMINLFPRHYARKACNLLEQVGLNETQLYRRTLQLSGGQQRVAIARAFLLDPALVLADEPVASLDPNTSRTILALLKQASRRYNATVFCSLHQVELALEYADRIVGMRDGRIVFDGRPGEFTEAEQQALYEIAASSLPIRGIADEPQLVRAGV